MADSIFYLNHKITIMKKHFLAFIAACSVLAACNGTPKSSDNTADNAEQPQAQALMSDAEGEGVPPSGTAGGANSSFIPRDDAQDMIDAYDSNPLANVTTKYYLADAAQLKEYLEYAEQHDIKDVQIILARNEGQLTIVITGVKPDGKHILYPDPNNSNIPSAIENCLPCPPGTDCYTTTNLSQ